MSVLAIRNLRIVNDSGVPIIHDISLEVRRGEVLALIGASGSGKTTLALTALGHLRTGLRHVGGTVSLDGTDMFAASEAELRALRGGRVAYVAQSAAAAFNPRIRLMDQVVESACLHRRQTRSEAAARAIDHFGYLSLPEPERIGRRYPWQLSGGQLQRGMLAMGIHEDPLLLVCDEPTSALDVTTQVDVMRLLKQAITDNGTSALFVSHDLAVVAQIATRIAVLRHGKLVEIGETAQILDAPREAYTRELLVASRQLSARTTPERQITASPPVLEAGDLTAGFGSVRDGRPQIVTLENTDVSVRPGEVVGIIGESGSGKTTLARVLAGVHAPAQGYVRLDGEELAPLVLARRLDQRRQIQLVLQMADTALNPRHRIRRILGRVLHFFHGMNGSRAEARMHELLAMVQLDSEYLDRPVRQLSGGEKQRVNLARALAADPKVIICDEITSALDTVVAQTVIALVDRLRRELGLAVLFVSHDLAAVSELCDQVIVMRRGRVVETGSTAEVLAGPRSAYVKLLIASAPELRIGWLEDAAARRDALRDELAATA